MNAPALRHTDPLSERLARLRGRRRDAGWAQELLDLGRELTMAEAGVVLAHGAEGWAAIAPDTGEAPPEPWAALATQAATGRGIAASAVGREGRWVFAAQAGPADGPGAPPRPAVLVLEVGSALPMDLVLTRERMAFLGALAEAGAVEAALQARAPQALAAAAAEALARATDRGEGLHEAAVLLAKAGLPGAERVALVLPRQRLLGLSDQRQLDPRAELPRRLLALAEEAVDRGAARHGRGPADARRRDLPLRRPAGAGARGDRRRHADRPAGADRPGGTRAGDGLASASGRAAVVGVLGAIPGCRLCARLP